jgi:hypothetical protein
MYTLSRHAASIRTILVVIALVGGVFVHPAIALVCMAALALAYTAYEVLFLGLMMDFIWQPVSLLHPLPLFTLAAILLLWLLEPVRSQLLS